MNTNTLTIKSKTENLSLVRDFISEAARKSGFDEEAINKISLAVDEACTNIIKHAYEFVSTGDIEISVTTTSDAFEVIIADNGKSFKSDSIKVPDMREYLSHFRRGGLGMHLMRTLMDKIVYTSSKRHHNEVHLIKHLLVNIKQ